MKNNFKSAKYTAKIKNIIYYYNRQLKLVNFYFQKTNYFTMKKKYTKH